MMKYLMFSIIGLFLFFGLKDYSSADGGDAVMIANDNETVEGYTGLDSIQSGTNIITGELISGLINNNFDTTLGFGDIEIEEIFPGSGNCLDEYIIITSHRDFSGYIDILGAGVSSGIVTVRVNMYSGEQIVVVDNVAGIKTTKQIILLPSITLTNGGEVLQLRYSGFMLDDIVYSDPRAAKSLLFTESIGGKKYFKSIKDSQLQTYCSDSEFITQPTSVIGGCSIGIDNVQDTGSGYYTLSLTVSSLSGCAEGALNKRFIESFETDVNVCQTSIVLGPGLHHLKYYGYSETGTLNCFDEIYFASKYDVGYIQTQYNSPGQCQNSQVSGIQNSKAITYFESKNCGIELQSPKLGFTIDSALNVRLLINGSGLSNSQSNYSCLVDFGNGEKIEECNPSSFYYKLSGMYTIGILIKDSRTGQPICSHTSFLYVPNGSILKDTKISESDDNDNVFLDSTGANCSGLFTGLYVYSILPNPKGSDSLQEELTLKGLSGNELLSQFILKIGKKNFNLSGIFVGQNLILKNTFGLLNKGMCIDLIHKYCGQVQHVCYANTKENEKVLCPDGGDVLCYYSDGLNSSNNNLSKDNACIEKINKLKGDHKSAIKILREKQKDALIKLRLDTKLSIQKLNDKERISRNSRYIRERSFQIIYDAFIHGEPSMILFIRDIQSINKYLISRLDKKNYFLSQYEKPKIYTYDIKKYITKYVTKDSLVLYFFPDLYIDVLNYHFSIENE